MIKINLLPPELQGKKGRVKASGGAALGGISPAAGTALMAAAAVLFAVAWFFVGYVLVWSPIAQAEAQEKKVKADYDTKKKEFDKKQADHAARFAKWKLMQDQKEILQELKPANRLLWSEKLNMLVNLIPKDIYITSLEVTETIDSVETEASRQARDAYTKKKKEADASAALDENQKKAKIKELGSEPKVINKQVISQTLTIKAATMVREDSSECIAKVIEFQKCMQQYEMKNAKGEVRRFKDSFEKTPDDQKLVVNMGPMEQELLDGVPVWAFELSINTEKPKDTSKDATKDATKQVKAPSAASARAASRAAAKAAGAP
jgi:hypothetical protein